jgi:hypothetical protein
MDAKPRDEAPHFFKHQVVAGWNYSIHSRERERERWGFYLTGLNRAWWAIKTKEKRQSNLNGILTFFLGAVRILRRKSSWFFSCCASRHRGFFFLFTTCRFEGTKSRFPLFFFGIIQSSRRWAERSWTGSNSIELTSRLFLIYIETDNNYRDTKLSLTATKQYTAVIALVYIVWALCSIKRK